MRKTLLSTAAILAALTATALVPSTANAETIATGCVTTSTGAVSRVRPFSASPTTACPRGSQRITFLTEVPGVTFLKRMIVTSDVDSETILLQRPPFTLVVFLDLDGTCDIRLRAVPDSLPLLIPGPNGSTLSDSAVPPGLLLLVASPQFENNFVDVARNVEPLEFISRGLASLLIDDIQLTVVTDEEGSFFACRAGVEARFSRPHFRRFTQ